MQLSSNQLEELKKAAATLLIIGRFRHPSEGEIIKPCVFEGAELSSQNFYDEIKPSLGRIYKDKTFIGCKEKTSIELQVPLNVDKDNKMQRIFPDSPLLQEKIAGNLADQGKELFSKVISLLDTITRFQHPDFSSDLIEVAWSFIVECHNKNSAETNSLAKSCRTLEIKRLIQLYLLSPSGDDAMILPQFAPLLKRRDLGTETEEIFVGSLRILKEILSSTDDIANAWKKTTKKGTNCESMADGHGYNSVPGIEPSATKDFRSAFRHLKLATDELHAICGSPELWSYMFWWLGSLAGKLDEGGHMTEETAGVMNLYKLCVQQQGQRVAAVGEKLLEERASVASAKLTAFGQDLEESVREIHRLQAQAILDEMRKIFNPNRPTRREDIEDKTAMLYKAMAFLVDKGFREKYEAYQTRFSSDVRISRDILNAKKEDGSGIESRAEFEAYLNKVSDESKNQVSEFLQSTAFTEVTEGSDIQLRVDTAFYGFLTDSVLRDFEAWAKDNETKSIEMGKRVERLFRYFHLGQLGSGGREMPGLPITVSLKSNTAQDLMLSVKKELDSRKGKPSTDHQASFQATDAINTAIGGVFKGKIFVGNESGGTWSKVKDTISLKLNKPISVESLPNAELRDESGKKLASQADTEPAVSKPKAPENEVKQVSLDLASLDHEVNAVIKESSIVIAEASDELTELSDADLINWEKLLKDAHNVYVEGGSDSGTRLILRSYRASTLGRFLLAAPDSCTAFGREDVSNIIGLLMDMAQHLGELHGDKTLDISNSQAEIDAALRKINLSQYYPVSNEAELSRVFNYHFLLIKSIENVRAYLSEVAAIAKLFDAAQGSDLRIVVLNKTLGEEVVANFASNNVLTKHPAGTAYLTSQNDPTDLAKAWGVLQQGLGTPTPLQVPVFVAHESLHSKIDVSKLPALVPSEGVIVPSADHCLGMPAGGEWLAVACACTSANADKLGKYLKTDNGHNVRGLGVLRPIKKDEMDKDGLGDVDRNELSNKGLIDNYVANRSVVAAIRGGLMKPKISNNYFEQLVCARLLTFALMAAHAEGKPVPNFPVKLIETLGQSTQLPEILSALFAGFTDKKITLTNQGGNPLDGSHKAIDKNTILRLSIGNQGEELGVFNLAMAEWLCEFADATNQDAKVKVVN